jgi:geranylgeranyl diphosphate synthase type II
MRSIPELQKFFNNALTAEQFSGTPKELYEPLGYILRLGGKRMRPVMLLHACEMFGQDASKALPQAIAIELFHNFTLMHDDIMDHAPLRRGLPTVHEKYNSTVAILSGDAMLVMAYKYLITADDALLRILVEIFNDCAIRVCEGQQLDMNFEKTDGLDVNDYLYMIELKTAALIATSLKMGALVAGASAADCIQIYEFGKHLGISFQLKDDWLDTFGSAEKVGKQPGGDIIQNKKTYLLIEALNIADAQTKSELNRWFSGEAFDSSQKVKSVTEIFKTLQIDHVAERESEKHFLTAFQHLDAVSLPNERKEILISLAKGLLERDS